MKIYWYGFIFSILLSLVVSQLHAQSDAIFRQFTIANYLPSNEVYCIYQDSKQNIWMGTDRGVVRYNSLHAKTFDRASGLSANAVFKIHEDKKGRIWFRGYSEPCYYDTELDQVISPKINKAIHELLQNKFRINDYKIIEDSIYLSVPLSLRLPDSLVIWYAAHLEDTILQKRILTKNHLGENLRQKVAIPLEEAVYLSIGNPMQTVQNIPQNREQSFRVTAHPDGYLTWDNLAAANHHVLSNGDILFYTPRCIYTTQKGIILDSLTIPRQSGNLLGVYEDTQQNLWAITKNGILYYGNVCKPQSPKVLLDGIYCTDLLMGVDGNLWISTFEGVFCLADLGLYYYKGGQSKKQQDFRKLIAWQDQILAVNGAGQFIDIAEVPNYQIFGSLGTKCPLYINDITQLDQAEYLLPDGSIWSIDNNQLSFKDKLITNQAKIWEAGTGFIKTMMYDSLHKHLYAGTSLNLYYGNMENGVEQSCRSPWINDFCISQNEGVLIGTQQGLYKYAIEKNQLVPLVDKQGITADKDISAIAENKFDIRFLGTKGAGLLVQTAEGIYSLSKDNNNLLSNFVECLYIEADTLIYLGTNKGFVKIEVDRKGQFKKLENYALKTEIPKIRDILVKNSQVYLATAQGVYRFDEQNPFVRQSQIYIGFQYLTVNGKKLAKAASYNLDNNQRNLKIRFLAKYYKEQNKLSYVYRLKSNKNTTWQSTDQNVVEYANLKSGTYTFEVYALLDNGEQSQLIQLPIYIEAYFSETYTFYFLLIGILFFVIFLYSFLLRRKTIAERKYLQAEAKALQSSMNPHFMFNAMNSISYFVYYQDKLQAIDYIKNFATLIRNILDASQKSLIPLEDELDILRIYIDLEKTRLEENTGLNYNFRITLIFAINTKNWWLPPMILQPLVENAILHGIAPQTRDGDLEVRIEKLTENKLRIGILDNGIGLEESKKINENRPQKNQSKGLEMLRQRIDNFNFLYKTQMRLQLQTRKDDLGNVLGTEAFLELNRIQKPV
ncbi:MAG: histidine kinase [Saprospiraceae bacterium]|nr:histidine kinase [Saprospiraceae bacterium]